MSLPVGTKWADIAITSKQQHGKLRTTRSRIDWKQDVTIMNVFFMAWCRWLKTIPKLSLCGCDLHLLMHVVSPFSTWTGSLTIEAVLSFVSKLLRGFVAWRISPPNDVYTSVEIPYWWRVSTQIWVVLLIGFKKQIFCQSRTQYPDMGRVASSLLNFCTRFSDVISRGSSFGAKCQLFC